MADSRQTGEGGMDVRYVANLARIQLTDAEVAAFQGQLSKVVDYFRELQQLDTGDVEPMAHASRIQNVFREDTPRESLQRDSVLANAPQTRTDLFVVPKIVE